MMNSEYIDSWSQALAKHAFPTNIQNAIDNYGTLVDHIWYYAGDRSHDVSNIRLIISYQSTRLS